MNCSRCGADMGELNECPNCGSNSQENGMKSVQIENVSVTSNFLSKLNKKKVIIVVSVVVAILGILGGYLLLTTDIRVAKKQISSYFEFKKTGKRDLLSDFIDPEVIALIKEADKMQLYDLSKLSNSDDSSYDYKIKNIKHMNSMTTEESIRYIKDKQSGYIPNDHPYKGLESYIYANLIDPNEIDRIDIYSLESSEYKNGKWSDNEEQEWVVLTLKDKTSYSYNITTAFYLKMAMSISVFS